MMIRHMMLAVVAALAALASAASAQTLQLERIRLPAGFTIELVARVADAREMTFGASGTLFAGSVGGRVYAIEFAASTNAQRSAVVHTIASGLRVGTTGRCASRSRRVVADC